MLENDAVVLPIVREVYRIHYRTKTDKSKKEVTERENKKIGEFLTTAQHFSSLFGAFITGQRTFTLQTAFFTAQNSSSLCRAFVVIRALFHCLSLIQFHNTFLHHTTVFFPCTLLLFVPQHFFLLHSTLHYCAVLLTTAL